MKTKSYLPPAAYRFGVIGSVLQIGIAVAMAATTLPGYRLTHLSLAAVHLGLMLFWLHQYRQATRFVPVKPANVMPLPAANLILCLAVLCAIGFEGVMLWMGYQSYLIRQRYQVPLQISTILSEFSMHVNPLMFGAIMIATARQHIDQAKAALVAVQEVQDEAEIAPTRTGWWTQDETRQELRRK
ncbi:MAG: hypothetical protein QM758_06860 [Armatimonas sp.]